MTLPFENGNRKIIRSLARSSLRTEKRRNIMAVVSIVLAAFILTLGGTILSSLIALQSGRVLDTYQAAYADLTEEQFQSLAARPEVEQAGLSESAGPFQQQEGYSAALLWMDETAQDMLEKQISLVEGEYPSAGNEIAVPQGFLMKQDTAGRIGSAVTLEMGGSTSEFIICGILKLPDTQDTYSFLISRDAMRVVPGMVNRQAYVSLSGARELDRSQVESLLAPVTQELGLSAPMWNDAALSGANRPSSESMLLPLLLGGLILIGGGVVVNSIFQISVRARIRMYGQLRTLGATRRQIRSMVRREGTRLTLIGIPAGVALGCAAGFAAFPQGAGVTGYVVSAAAACGITWLMVRLSLRTPVKIASGASPVEAARFEPERRSVRVLRPCHRRLTPLRLALRNFGRDKEKTVGIVLSLCFGGILLLVSASLLASYSPEANARLAFQYGDFKIYLDSEESSMGDIQRAGNPLTEELREQVLALDGVQDVVPTRRSVGSRYSADFQPNGSGMCDLFSDEERPELEKLLISGRLPENNREILMVFPYEECRPGDTVELTLDGMAEPVQVTVAGILNIYQYHKGNEWLQTDGPMLAAPEALARELLPQISDFSYTWEVVTNPDQNEAVESRLKELLRGRDLSLYTIEQETDSYASQWKAFTGGAQVLSWLMFLFGLINLINVMLSNQLARRMEVSMMRSVGLTRKQMGRMMMAEGMLYVLISTGIMLAAGVPLSVLVCREMGQAMYHQAMAYVFPVWQILAYVGVLFGVQVLLSLYAIRSLKKKSLVEQLRETE